MRAMTMMDFSPAPVSDKAEHMLSLYMREPMLSKALFENPPFVDMVWWEVDNDIYM